MKKCVMDIENFPARGQMEHSFYECGTFQGPEKVSVYVFRCCSFVWELCAFEYFHLVLKVNRLPCLLSTFDEYSCCSKGPCDVFDPWVRWERGQVGI